MKIEIKLRNGKKLYLTSDSNQFIVCDDILTSKDKKGKLIDTRVNSHYYSNLKNALYSLFEFGLLKSDSVTVKELSKDLEHISNLIKDIY